MGVIQSSANPMLNLPTIHRLQSQSQSQSVVDTSLPLVSPSDLCMPDKFTSWRSSQWDSVQRIINSSKRFVAIAAPTGFGKSLSAFAAATLGGRTVILTATKGLQDQLRDDFESISDDIRGLNNYLCPIPDRLGIPKDTAVADAPCQCGYNCGLKRGGCGYYDLYRHAQSSGIVVTNYQCWLYDGAKESADRGDLQYGLPVTGTVDEISKSIERQKVRMLIADECSDASEQLSMFLGVEFSRRECLGIKLDWPDSGLTVDDWQQWAMKWIPPVDGRLAIAEERVKLNGGKGWAKEIKHLRDMKRKLDRLVGMQADDGWIMNEQDVEGRSMTGVRFDPLSPARYAEQALWRGIDKVVLVSATVRPKTAELLGIKPSELEFVEYDSSFDVKRRPVIFVPTVRMDYRTEQDDHAMKWLLNKLDSMIGARLDRKGIIHAVSYKRARFIKDNSQYGHLMMVHDSRTRAQVVEEFRRREAPAILVSPSVDTGYDFHGDQCRYQLIIKIPFASVQNKVVKARQDRDKEYGMYMAAQTIVQMTGRSVRSESDWSETILTDSQAEWFIPRIRKFLPRWWMEAYQICDVGLPEPLEFDEPATPENNSDQPSLFP